MLKLLIEYHIRYTRNQLKLNTPLSRIKKMSMSYVKDNDKIYIAISELFDKVDGHIIDLKNCWIKLTSENGLVKPVINATGKKEGCNSKQRSRS